MASHEHDDSSFMDGGNLEITPATSLDPSPVSNLGYTYPKQPAQVHPQDVKPAVDFGTEDPIADAGHPSRQMTSSRPYLRTAKLTQSTMTTMMMGMAVKMTAMGVAAVRVFLSTWDTPRNMGLRHVRS
ncbi:hypothetical protein VMCG_04092 [Cytospora schulzeri]|uniref:Uncharacterized protein n=1 Tax=Cytospora schulzeri TaxID=448051 RepID=A0A423WUC7_9PEZI|nr:hypothetical protein VMCG_04092 [Valsa malicola]